MKVSMNPLVFVFVILELSSFNVDCQVEPVAPYITFRGIVLQNHSYIDYYQIGNSIIDGVQCHTDLTTCCSSSYGSHGGRWYSYATGRTLNSYSSYYGNALYQREFHQGLAILSNSRYYYLNGLYRCDIDTNASTDGDRNDTDVSRRESVYVGIYSNGGNLQLESNSYIILNDSYITREVTVTVHSMDPLLVTLTCITTGGPATNVTWTQDSEEIEGGVTVLESGASSRYRHTLYNVTEGVYTCTVWNNKPSVVTAEVNVAVPSPPSNLSVTHLSLTSVNVSWSPAPQDDVNIDGYIIYYQLVPGGSKRTHRTESNATSIIIRSFERGGEYSFSMVSTYNGIPSTEIGPLNISIVISPPSNLSVIQLSLTSVNVSWSPAPQDDVYYGYTIYYQLVAGSSKSTHRTGSTATSTIIRSLEQGGEYSFSMVSTINGIPSTEIGPLNISLVESVNTSVEISHDPPFYVGTSLNLTCKVDLPNTVDPKIIRSVRFSTDIDHYDLELSPGNINFHPLRMRHSGIYGCRVCLIIRDHRSSTACSVGNKTYIPVLDLPPPRMEISVEPLATVGSVRTINCSVSVVPHLITSPHVELYGPDKRLLASGNTNSSFTHTLDPVKSLNAGVYECNGVLQIKSANIYLDSQSFIHLSVQLPQPQVTITASPRKTLTSGYPVTLTCTAILNPHIDAVGAISLSWGGPRMIFSNKPYSVTESGFGLHYTSSLTMSDIQSQDEGVYTCTVRVAGDRDIIGNVVTESITIRVRGSRPGRPPSGFPTRGRG